MSAPIDLHVHTNASDGIHSPSQVVALARKQGMETIAITDHDTLGGVPEALEAASPTGLQVISGVEISTEAGETEVHILGYWVDYRHERLSNALARFRDARIGRAHEILSRLAALGLPLTWERVLCMADGGSVGRPHIARALLQEGYVSSVPEAFARYLAHGQPAYVPRAKVVPEQAIDLIAEAGGIAVLAHPWEARALLPDLVARGLDGLEVYYTGYSAEMIALLRQLALEHGLLCTGGSDFHGYEILPANVLGGVRVPRSCLAALVAARKQRCQAATCA